MGVIEDQQSSCFYENKQLCKHRHFREMQTRKVVFTFLGTSDSEEHSLLLSRVYMYLIHCNDVIIHIWIHTSFNIVYVLLCCYCFPLQLKHYLDDSKPYLPAD